jgi:hypothetical protein
MKGELMPRSTGHRELTLDQQLELMIGPGRIPGTEEYVSNFESDEERREAWLAHGERVREGCAGTPWAAEHVE